MTELYNLSSDEGETNDLADERPEIVSELRTKFDAVIARGASRPGMTSANDATVNYAVTQTERWAPVAD